MDHFIGMNVHRDQEQAVRTLRHITTLGASGILVYYDGPGAISPELKKLAGTVIEAEHESDKVKSLIGALNALVLRSTGATLSFMHADMLPTNMGTFANFVARFQKSGKAMTYKPMWPKHECIDFCNLHLNCDLAINLGIIPAKISVPDHPDMYFNEYVLSQHLGTIPDLSRHLYHLWSMVWPYTGSETVDKLAHNMFRYFTYHNYCPETSIIHTNDLEFWDHLEEFCV